jgi:hypothetical protein
MWWSLGCRLSSPAAAAFFKLRHWLLEQLLLLQQCLVAAAGWYSSSAVGGRGPALYLSTSFALQFEQCRRSASTAAAAVQQRDCPSKLCARSYQMQQRCGICCGFVSIVHARACALLLCAVRGMQRAVHVCFLSEGAWWCCASQRAVACTCSSSYVFDAVNSCNKRYLLFYGNDWQVVVHIANNGCAMRTPCDENT